MQVEDQTKSSASTNQCPVAGIGREFNPFVDPYLAEPYGFWLRARKEEPVFHSPELDYWVVTRYEDSRAIFADTKTCSASITQSPISPLAPQVVQILQTGGLKPKAVLSNADAPDHLESEKCNDGQTS